MLFATADHEQMLLFEFRILILLSSVVIGTGIRGLMRGMEPSPKLTRSY